MLTFGFVTVDVTSVHDLSLQEVIVTKAVETAVVVDGMSEWLLVDVIWKEDSTETLGKVDDFPEEMEDMLNE